MAKKDLESYKNEILKKFGHKSAALGSEEPTREVIPTGILSLDYALGIGGWPRGQLVSVFGPRDIGKSSAIGLAFIREAQTLGLTPAIVAAEPNFDPRWATKHGVDPDNLIISRPTDANDAFNMLHKYIEDNVVDVVLFDSIGALLRPSEIEVGGKPSQGGSSQTISWGVTAALQRTYKTEKTVMFLNQVRDDMKSRISGLYRQPGGHALEHSCSIIVQVMGGDSYSIKESYGSKSTDIVVGREIVCKIVRNKMSEGTNRRASFDFYSMETDEYPFGVDTLEDVVRTAKRAGVFKARGAWLDYERFPNGQLNGVNKVKEWLIEHPEEYINVRNDVIHSIYRGEVDSPKEDMDEANA